jgi:hypothetical protein
MTPRKKTLARTSTMNYTDFLRSIQPIWISLVETSFAGDRAQYFEHKEHELSVSWNAEPVEFGAEFFEVKAQAVIRLSPTKSRESFFSLSATYHLHIHASAPLNRDHVKRFVGGELRLLVWPYVREYTSSVSGRMHVPPVLLPLTGSEDR